MLAVIFSSFNFHIYLESSVLLTYFLWRKFLVWFLKRSLNDVSAIPKYCLSGLLDALYTMFAVKHLLSSGYSAVSTIASMVARSWLNNSSIVGSDD